MDTVFLKSKGGKRKSFSIIQAKSLLTLPLTEWKLDDENYLFEKNDLQRKPNKGVTSNEAKPKK